MQLPAQELDVVWKDIAAILNNGSSYNIQNIGEVSAFIYEGITPDTESSFCIMPKQSMSIKYVGSSIWMRSSMHSTRLAIGEV